MSGGGVLGSSYITGFLNMGAVCCRFTFGRSVALFKCKFVQSHRAVRERLENIRKRERVLREGKGRHARHAIHAVYLVRDNIKIFGTCSMSVWLYIFQCVLSGINFFGERFFSQILFVCVMSSRITQLLWEPLTKEICATEYVVG